VTRPALAPALAGLLLAAAGACHGQATQRPHGEVEEPPERAGEPRAEVEHPAGTEPESAPELEPYKPPSSLGAPVAIRRAKRTRTVFDAPGREAQKRGRIPRGETFHLYEKREGPGCDRPWGLVAESAWVCLERTEKSDEAPLALPVLEDGALLPFIYARHEHHDDPSTPPLPVYESLSDFRGGAEPKLTLPAYGSYAFTRERHNRGRPVLVTPTRDVVPTAGLELFEASEFHGRELRDAPIPPERTLAWAVRWKTLVRAAPDPAAAQVDRVKYHDAVLIVGEGVLGPEGGRWYEVPGDEGTSPGWVAADDIRRFVPVAPPEPVLGGQITLDVDLDEQVLSVWIEDEPVFVTLISSGKLNDRTPLGVYRVETKRAYGKMESIAGARDPYYVDAVPWTMYFQGRYALHASYWHDMFGHRMSHGCVNLSPRDAKRVFELASPRLPPGWLIVHEHASDPGAVVRIRRGDEPVPDERQPLG
jgi:lipoprotein-anchoring transpeptidase ErfK/SrfK